MSLISCIKNYGKEIASSRASWTNFAKIVTTVTRSTSLLDYTALGSNLSDFILYTPRWTIGGAAFSGIMRTNHLLQVQATHYPVQSGSIMTDHAILIPAELDIDVKVSDAEVYPRTIKTGNRFIDTAMDLYSRFKGIKKISDLFTPQGQIAISGERGVSAWNLFRGMIVGRVPVDVVTRLGVYHNMLLISAEAPDDVTTLHGLNCTLHFEQIDVAQVAEVQTSARKQTTGNTASGAQPVDTSSAANTGSVAHGIKEALGGLK